MSEFRHDPNAALDYRIDWTQWLAEDEAVTTSTWAVPDGLAKGSDAHDDTTCTVWLSGGTVGVIYDVTNHVVTSQGRTDDRSFRVRVVQR